MFEVKIVADSPATLAMLVADMAATLNPTALTGEEGIKVGAAAEKSKSSRKKAEPQTVVVEGNTVTDTDQVAADDTVEDNPGVTYADVQKAVTQLAAAKGRDAVIAVFDTFGVDHGTKLTETQWPEAVTALNDARESIA